MLTKGNRFGIIIWHPWEREAKNEPWKLNNDRKKGPDNSSYKLGKTEEQNASFVRLRANKALK